MVTATVEMWFCAAHRIKGHPKCGRLHGHNYKVQVTIARPAKATMNIGELDEQGFIMDFGVLKQFIKEVCDVVDHKYIVSNANLEPDGDPYQAAAYQARLVDHCVVLDIPQSSVEHLVQWFKESLQMLLVRGGHANISVMEVKLWETNKSYATW